MKLIPTMSDSSYIDVPPDTQVGDMIKVDWYETFVPWQTRYIAERTGIVVSDNDELALKWIDN